jgi:hypothetical protein
MAHPYYHSLSSVQRWGGTPDDFAPVHQWLDASKQFIGHFRHRALRHHAEGAALAARIFGPSLDLGDARVVSVEDIASLHIQEDLGFIPSLSEWFHGIEVRLVSPRDDLFATDQSLASVEKWGGEIADYLPIHDFIDQDFGLGSLQDNRLVRHHSEGIFLAESVFGSVITNRDQRVVPTRVIAELHVNMEMGRIPSVSEILTGIKVQSWMMKVAKPSRAILSELSR